MVCLQPPQSGSFRSGALPRGLISLPLGPAWLSSMTLIWLQFRVSQVSSKAELGYSGTRNLLRNHWVLHFLENSVPISIEESDTQAILAIIDLWVYHHYLVLRSLINFGYLGKKNPVSGPEQLVVTPHKALSRSLASLSLRTFCAISI